MTRRSQHPAARLGPAATAGPGLAAPGFALLEALVAIVIMAGTGAALFAMVNTGLQGMARAEAHMVTTGLQPQLLAWVRSIDLADLPARRQSTITLQSGTAQYRAQAGLERIRGPRPVVSGTGTPGIHHVALYDVTITLYDNNRRLNRIRTRRVASKQVAEPPRL